MDNLWCCFTWNRKQKRGELTDSRTEKDRERCAFHPIYLYICYRPLHYSICDFKDCSVTCMACPLKSPIWWPCKKFMKPRVTYFSYIAAFCLRVRSHYMFKSPSMEYIVTVSVPEPRSIHSWLFHLLYDCRFRASRKFAESYMML